jgi:tetratricopeptide (TPR) repeat protein
MTKKLIMGLILSICSIATFAQNVFELTDLSKPNDVFSGEENEACVIIRCHHSIPLSFSSTMDKEVKPWNTEREGNDSIYYLSFPTDERYRGRILSIISPGYYGISRALELQPKQLLTFQLTDPNSTVDAGCYRGHRNLGLEEFKNMSYEAARTYFVTARECTDVDSVENEKNIAAIDSVLYHRSQADRFYSLLDYRAAEQEYKKAAIFNPYDTYISGRVQECTLNFVSECDINFKKAEYYYNEKEYDKALELYKKTVNSNCSQAPEATAKINTITSYKLRKKNHANVFTYEYTKNMPIGFHYGRYNMHKVGGFFALSTNRKIFKAMQKDCGLEDYPELSLKFGWTFKIANPVWAFIGPGVAAKLWYGDYYTIDKNGEFVPKDGTSTSSKDYEKGYPMDGESKLDPEQEGWDNEKLSEKIHVGFAIPVTAGIVVKYSWFALRLGYEYRFCPQKRLDEFMGKHRFTIGAGIAF